MGLKLVRTMPFVTQAGVERPTATGFTLTVQTGHMGNTFVMDAGSRRVWQLPHRE